MYLSAYRIMWVQVIFDLPVKTRAERKDARVFRDDLLDLGFEMVQFSVYHRFCEGKEAAESLIKKVELKMPIKGKVHILCFTDKQFENIKSFYRGAVSKNREIPGQLTLF